MKRIQILIALLLLVIIMSGCIFGDDDKSSGSANSLIGTWEYFNRTERDTVTFNKDGTFSYGFEYNDSHLKDDYLYGTYSISGSIVTLTYHEYSGGISGEYNDPYTFSIDGDTLTMRHVYYNNIIKYSKVKS